MMTIGNILSVRIYTEYVKLEQFLKLVDIISSGGEAKAFLAENEIFVNGERENRRGRKLRNGDQIEIDGRVYAICRSED